MVKTQIGPVVDEKQLLSNLAYVDVGRSEAATVIGGDRLDLGTPGFFQSPALFVGTENDMRINREEIFGPCASVIKISDLMRRWRLPMTRNLACHPASAPAVSNRPVNSDEEAEAGMVIGQSANSRGRLSRPLWWQKGIIFRPPRTGALCVGVFIQSSKHPMYLRDRSHGRHSKKMGNAVSGSVRSHVSMV